MKQISARTILIAAVCVLSAVLVGLCILTVQLHNRDLDPTLSSQATDSTPGTQSTTAPGTEPSTEPATQPSETTAPTQPPQTEFVLTFAGDCTFANREGRTDRETFLMTVGDNYAHPFADVYDIFSTDDCTFINLECVLSDNAKAPADKTFVFKGPTRYTNIMTMGSVEFANIVNNHIVDYGDEGYADTLAALDDAGILYCEKKDTMVFTTEGGLKIGVYADLDPRKIDGIYVKMKELRDMGAEVIVAIMHWGIEYQYRANSDQVRIAHTLVDAGADIVYGHHPHVLQEIERYNGGIIYYSLGNFSFGGNTNPADKDTAILQQHITRNPDGSIELGELDIIPCYVSGILGYGNDYQPCPMEEGTEAYERVLKKLKGTYSNGSLYVPGRDDLYGTTEAATEATTVDTSATEPPATQAPTDPPATEPPTEAAQPPAETQAPESSPEDSSDT